MFIATATTTAWLSSYVIDDNHLVVVGMRLVVVAAVPVEHDDGAVGPLGDLVADLEQQLLTAQQHVAAKQLVLRG